MRLRAYVTGMSLMLSLGSLLLGGLLYLQWHEDPATGYPVGVTADEPAPEEPQAPNIPPFTPTPLQSLAEITERPLFAEGRAPPEKPAEDQPGTAPVAPLRLKLEGVAITPENKVAIITDLQTNELLRLSQGMSHGNWKVTEVTEKSATVQQGARQLVLTLELKETPGTAAGSRPKPPFRLPLARPPTNQ